MSTKTLVMVVLVLAFGAISKNEINEINGDIPHYLGEPLGISLIGRNNGESPHKFRPIINTITGQYVCSDCSMRTSPDANAAAEAVLEGIRHAR